MNACMYIYAFCLNTSSISFQAFLLSVPEEAGTHVERNQYLMFLIVLEWQESSKQILRHREATICKMM